MVYDDELFEDVTVTLDGNTFNNCTFRNAVLEYSGKGVTMSNCNFQSFSFAFGGDLAEGLYTLYQLFGTEGMLKIIRGTAEGTSGQTVNL